MIAIVIILLSIVLFLLYIRRKITTLAQRISETQAVVINHNKILIQLSASVKEIQEIIVTNSILNQTKNIDRTFPS